MAGHDENFRDSSGVLSIIMGLIVLVAMSALPATVGWYQVVAGLARARSGAVQPATTWYQPMVAGRALMATSTIRPMMMDSTPLLSRKFSSCPAMCLSFSLLSG